MVCKEQNNAKNGHRRRWLRHSGILLAGGGTRSCPPESDAGSWGGRAIVYFCHRCRNPTITWSILKIRLRGRRAWSMSVQDDSGASEAVESGQYQHNNARSELIWSELHYSTLSSRRIILHLFIHPRPRRVEVTQHNQQIYAPESLAHKRRKEWVVVTQQCHPHCAVVIKLYPLRRQRS
jgi:hypothetical protein